MQDVTKTYLLSGTGADTFPTAALLSHFLEKAALKNVSHPLLTIPISVLKSVDWCLPGSWSPCCAGIKHIMLFHIG